jgi:hypothetical protein
MPLCQRDLAAIIANNPPIMKINITTIAAVGNSGTDEILEM